MTIKVAINGYGRIGRNILRAHYEGDRKHDLQIVAINDLGPPETNAHLTRYDTAHGKFPGKVEVEGDHMTVNGDKIKVVAQRDPSQLPWKDLGVDVVLECTGFFTSKEKASAHLKGGARKVIISAPGGKDVDATVVYGVNHGTLKAAHTVISNASCTTNCLAPLVKPLHDAIGLVNGLMTTVHAYTNDQVLTDVFHEDLRRARSATQSMIPAKTGAASAVGLVLPELNGKLDGYAIRVPTINVSIVDLCFIAARDTTVDEVNGIMKKASESGPAGQGVLVVRQRVGLLQPDARHDDGPHGREVTGGAVRNPFTAHPRDVGETYLEHGRFACRYGAKMAAGGVAALLHGVFPFLFPTTGSRITRELMATLEASAARQALRQNP